MDSATVSSEMKRVKLMLLLLLVAVDFLCRSSRFLNSNSFSNFSRPGLKDLTKGGVDCLGGVLGGNFLLLSGGFESWAYVLAVGELLVPTWVDFRE